MGVEPEEPLSYQTLPSCALTISRATRAVRKDKNLVHVCGLNVYNIIGMMSIFSSYSKRKSKCNDLLCSSCLCDSMRQKTVGQNFWSLRLVFE